MAPHPAVEATLWVWSIRGRAPMRSLELLAAPWGCVLRLVSVAPWEGISAHGFLAPSPPAARSEGTLIRLSTRDYCGLRREGLNRPGIAGGSNS
jgi:hypothetical protein